MSLVAFADLRTAAYCPRKLYYERRSADRSPPADVTAVRDLAFRYDDLLERSLDALASEPIAVDPATYRATLERSRERLAAIGGSAGSIEDEPADRSAESDATGRVDATREVDGAERENGTDRWTALREPAARDRLVTGRDCRGIVHKVLEGPPEPALVSAGRPPDWGVWAPQSVHAVAAAKALAWEARTPVESAIVEYPAHGAIRRIELTTRRKARYRRTLRTVRELDGPPPRVKNRSKCEACEFADECGVRTRSLRSLLGFG